LAERRSLIDLSQEVFTGAPRWPSHPPTKIEYVARHDPEAAEAGNIKGMTYASMYLQLSDHGTTHTDSISHIDERPGAPDIDDIPLDRFYTRAIALDFTGMVRPREEISLELLRSELDRHGLEPPRDGTFLFTAGHHRRTFPNEAYTTEYPGLSEEAGDFLYRECGVFNVGQDAPSIDAAYNASRGLYPCHLLCRELQRVNSENLANIEAVAGLEFRYIGLPLKIRDGTGSPIRAVAVLDDRQGPGD
jgi:kynurenine formamidase